MSTPTEALTVLSGALPAKLDSDQKENVVLLLNILTGNIDGIDASMSNDRVQAARLSVFQPVSDEEMAPYGIKQGDMYTDGEIVCAREEGEPLLIFPVLVWKTHQRWPQGENKPDCWSEDGEYAANGQKCMACPDFPWRDGKMQSCRDITRLIALTADLRHLIDVSFKGHSMKAARIITKLIKSQGGVGNVKVALSTELQKGGQGKYYTFVAKSAGRPTPAEKEVILGFYEPIQGARQLMLDSYAARRGGGLSSTPEEEVIEVSTDDLDM